VIAVTAPRKTFLMISFLLNPYLWQIMRILLSIRFMEMHQMTTKTLVKTVMKTTARG